MKYLGRFSLLGLGLLAGISGTLFYHAASRPVLANNDRHEDYILCTGPVVTGSPYGAMGAGAYGPGLPGNPAFPGGRNLLPNGGVPNIVAPNGYSDGIWMLDYRSGKLLGTIVHSNLGKVLNWAEVDLVNEFKIAPKQNVHFLMTTGSQVNGQTALYVAETVTGQFAVYTMSLLPNQQGVEIRRHDATRFR